MILYILIVISQKFMRTELLYDPLIPLLDFKNVESGFLRCYVYTWVNHTERKYFINLPIGLLNNWDKKNQNIIDFQEVKEG